MTLILPQSECNQESFVSLYDCCFDKARGNRFTRSINDYHLLPQVSFMLVPKFGIVKSEVSTVCEAHFVDTRVLTFKNLVNNCVAMFQDLTRQSARFLWEVIPQHRITLNHGKALPGPCQCQHIVSQDVLPVIQILWPGRHT